MEKIVLNKDENLDHDLEKALQESLQNKDFCTLVKRLKIKKD